MKKLYTILILAVLVLSMVPAAFAQEGKIYKTMSAEPAEENDTQEPIRERLNVLRNESTQEREQIRERIQNLSEQNLSLRERIQERLKIGREITKEKIEQARERYQEAKEKYQTAKERYAQAKSMVREVKGVIAKCREEDGSERCVQARSQIKVHSKDFLSNTADRIINVLEKLKAKVEANEDLTEEQAAEMIEDIDAKIAEIQAAKESAENLTNVSTKQEIQEAARVLKQKWVKTRVVAKRNAGRLVNEKIGGIIVRAEKLQVKLERILAKLESQGYDTSGIEDKLAEFDAEITAANEKYEAARAQLETRGEANRLMKEARQNLKNAHFILKDIFFSIKGIADGQRLLEAPAEELEEEDEIEEDEEEPEVEDEEELEDEEEDDDEEETEPNTTVVIVGPEE
jgi:chromosome segregation ATPase